MKLYIEAKTNIKDLIIEYIEVILNNGRRVSLNWDESEITRTEEGFEAKYKGVYFGEEYANGCIDQLDPIGIADVGFYTEDEVSDVELELQHLQFVDALTDGSEKTLDLNDVLVITNLQLANEAFSRIEDFVKDWLGKYPQYLDELRDEEDIVDDDGHIFDIAYDMKGDVENEVNPFSDESCGECEKEEIGDMFDDWYDELVAYTIVPILKNIHWNLNNKESEKNND